MASCLLLLTGSFIRRSDLRFPAKALFVFAHGLSQLVPHHNDVVVALDDGGRLGRGHTEEPTLQRWTPGDTRHTVQFVLVRLDLEVPEVSALVGHRDIE